MTRHWTFNQKVGAGFAVIVLLAVVICAVSVYALDSVVASKDRVITVNAQLLIGAEKLRTFFERKVATSRGYLFSREEHYLNDMHAARNEFATILDGLKQDVVAGEARHQIDAIERAEAEHQQALERVIAMRRSDAPMDTMNRTFEEQVFPKREQLYASISAFVSLEEKLLEEARAASTQTAATATAGMIVVAFGVVFFATLVAMLLTRSLGRQVGASVGQVQSSSAELQSAANQQATGAREQATAMNEITTTINELLATSRQIAESAQRVAQIAEQTAGAAHAGESTVAQAHDSIAGIRRQVDMVVEHMLDLGRKSQQIGAVLDIVAELAEQTNILAINATVEAAGAGEAGKRFAVVADEIRKLADRVGGSTKDIRTLIDDVRSAVNTTVMATETGSKAVEAGTRQFDDVAAAFKQIAGLVTTTTEAAREIELSTKQQTSAVEQVNVAITDVAQTTRETEASAGQTLQTASQLAGLSKDLLRLVQPRVAV